MRRYRYPPVPPVPPRLDGHSDGHHHSVALKDYTDARLLGVEYRIMGILDERELRIEALFEAADKAVAKSEASIDRRLELLNAFRATAADEAKKYVLAVSVEQTNHATNEHFSRLDDAVAELRGRSLALAGFGAIFGGAVAAIVTHLLGG